MLHLANARAPIRPVQLRRLQALWHLWTRSLRLSPEQDRALRHYYVYVFSRGAARETLELDRETAGGVIAWLEMLTSPSSGVLDRAAGTAGRHGFPERRRVRPSPAAWRALWGVSRALGMSRADLDRFIAEHYGKLGLYGFDDVRTMADLNRVLWGLKSILRRRPRAARLTHKKAA
jgi:hypothetical protein